jgi:hypothetical protein
MTHDSSTTPVSSKTDTMLIVAEWQSFVAFDRSIDNQLEQLVARWIHMAAPNASRPLAAARKQFGR